MNNKEKISLISLCSFGLLSIIFTILVLFVDVKVNEINNYEIGLCSLNEKVFKAIGENHIWYVITELLGYIAILVIGVFAFFGIFQLIKRKKLKQVDLEIIGLGIVYIVIFVIYVLFDKVLLVNVRPVLESGSDTYESSFPSSHTLLACVVFSSSLLEAKKLISNKFIRNNLIYVIEFLVIIMVGGRLLSGVHWLSDIIAGVLYAGTIVSCYYYVMYKLINKQEKELGKQE